MKTLKTISETNKVKRDSLIKIKGGNTSNSISYNRDEDGMGNQMRPRKG